MPRPRRKPRTRRADLEVLSKDQRQHLASGTPFFDGYKTPEDFAVAWEIHLETVLAWFTEKYPGRRPYAWWQLDQDEAARREMKKEGETAYLRRKGLLSAGEEAALAAGKTNRPA